MTVDGVAAVAKLGHPPARLAPLNATFKELVDALSHWRIWVGLGVFDIRARYRRTSLGPFWMVIATAASVALLGVLYGKIFHFDLKIYLPFIAVGLVVWSLLSGLLGESPSVLYLNGHILRNYPISPLVFVLRLLVRQAVILLHNAIPVAVTLAVFAVPVSPVQLLALVGLAIVFLNGIWLGLFLGIVGARFRDISEIINLLLSIAFLTTPVMWRPEMLGDLAFLTDYNPLANLLEIVRAPLLGQIPAMHAYAYCLVMLAAGSLLALVFYHRYRRFAVFWV